MDPSTRNLPNSQTVRTTLLLLSDTHNLAPLPSNFDHVAYRDPLPKVDVLIHTGDITMSGKIHEYQQVIAALMRADAELKLVIAGNHDITLDEEYYEKFGAQMHAGAEQSPRIARELWASNECKEAGIQYLSEGTYTFKLNNKAEFTVLNLLGGKRLRSLMESQVYASPFQPEFCNWAFGYLHHQDRFNKSSIGTGFQATNPIPEFPAVDVMMTHGPPFQILDKTTTGEQVGCPHLLRAARRCRPRLHCFGHIHEAWGATKVSWNKTFDSIPSDRSGEESEHSGAKETTQSPFSAGHPRTDHPIEIDISDESDDPLCYGKETMFVNSSIMDVRYRPIQSPWVIHLELPRVKGS